MEDPKDGELVEKGKLSIPTGKSMDYLMDKWNGNADERQRKEDERNLVLLFINLTYKNFGATVSDLKKLNRNELLELKNRILDRAEKNSREYGCWALFGILALIPIFFMNPSSLMLLYIGASIMNLYVFAIYSLVRGREDFYQKFNLLNKKLYGNGDRQKFPEDCKETFQYFEKHYGEEYRKLLSSDLRRL